MSMVQLPAMNLSLKRGLEELDKRTDDDNAFALEHQQFAIIHDDVNDGIYADAVSDYDSEEKDVDEEVEMAVAKALVKAAFSKKMSASDIVRLIGTEQKEPPTKKARVTPPTKQESTFVALKLGRMSASAPALVQLSQQQRSQPTQLELEKPEDCLRGIQKSKGLEYKTFPASSLTGFFTEVTDEAVPGYTFESVQMVRDENIEGLRKVVENGKSLQCSNKFGETLVHSVCRRGSVAVLQFLLKEAGVTCKESCDSGRTPLHDACWTSRQNYALLGALLETCPDLLYITDRGFTPLAYIPKEHYDDWCSFLYSCSADRPIPKDLQLAKR